MNGSARASGTGKPTPEENLICADCIEEGYLNSIAHESGRDGDCDFCGETGKCITLNELADPIEKAFMEHYVRTSTEPNYFEYLMLKDKEIDYEWNRDGEPIVDAIESAAEIPRDAAELVQFIVGHKHSTMDPEGLIEEDEFSSDSHYEEKASSDYRWQERWSELERSLTKENRFFSKPAATLLDEVFDGLETLKTQGGRRVIVDAGPQSAHQRLYRARVFESEKDLKEALTRPDRHLGPPPPERARAGRMNAHGISMFYGASDPRVALAEIRPPVGSKVAVACFEVTRPVRLLDLTALALTVVDLSIFDPESKAQFERAAFLRRLGSLITKPVTPENELAGYLSTQVVADYLAQRDGPSIDGIVFPSVQCSGSNLNVTLFHKAALVEEIDAPKGATFKVSRPQLWEDNHMPDYYVQETAPVDAPPTNPDPQPFAYGLEGASNNKREPARPVTLRIDLDSIRIHEVAGVSFSTEECEVRRHRVKPTDEPSEF